MGIGPGELIVIFIVALLVFGPRKLPEIGKAIGKGISELRRATQDHYQLLESEMSEDYETSKNTGETGEKKEI